MIHDDGIISFFVNTTDENASITSWLLVIGRFT